MKILSVIVATQGLALGCQNLEHEAQVALENRRPLQPMAYTEFLGTTPGGIEVRESRIERALLDTETQWGHLSDIPEVDLSSPQRLQERFINALFQRDARLWDALFISAEEYKNMVGLSLEESERFVENIQSKSQSVWDIFEKEPESEGLQGGFGEVFAVEPLDVGKPRLLSGKLVDENETNMGEQFWGSSFKLRWKQKGSASSNKNAQVSFTIHMPKILRVHRNGITKYVLGSHVSVSPNILLFLRTGIHLKPELLRSSEYPIPLTVGNYWRYRRYIGENQTEQIDPFRMAPEEDDVMKVDATRAVDEVIRVDDYHHWKLVEMRRSYNDTELTKISRWWLVFPRGIYLCHRYCRANIENPKILLRYIRTRVPLFSFPIHGNLQWSYAGLPKRHPLLLKEAKKTNKARRFKATSKDDESPLELDRVQTHMTEAMTSAAGSFDEIVRIESHSTLDTFPITETGLVFRDFVWGKGIVRRYVEDENLTEELIELRVR